MSNENHKGKLKVRIGRVQAKAVADNYFPLIGDKVTIDATTKWAQGSSWALQVGDNTINRDGTLSEQKDSINFDVTAVGELTQVFTAHNSLTEKDVRKSIYAMTPQVHPYFDVRVSKEIVRADGEQSDVFIDYENGYNGINIVEMRIYQENEESVPVRTIKTMSATATGKKCSVEFTTTSERGIYDIEVDVTDIATGVTFSKRINKLITVTPRLAPEPADKASGFRDIFATKSYTGYSPKEAIDFYIRLWENTGEGLHYAEMVVPAGEQNGTCFYPAIDIGVLPSGTTLVLLDDAKEATGYARRLLIKGNNPTSVSADSGTPNNSFEKPLIITINQFSSYIIPFQYYGGFSTDGNIRHMVIDGRGYKNITKGIHIRKHNAEAWGETCMFLTNGTSDVEMFEVELSDCNFTAISAKTDPNVNRPWYWFGNWEFNRLSMHHLHIHDTECEGFYLGYFTPETMTGVNNDGIQVGYRAHSLSNTRIYRLFIENCGYDAMQLSNARNADVCYNEVYNSSWRGEKDQASGISIQSMSGRCYNNVIRTFQGPGMQIGPLGELEVFNNVVSDCPEGQPGILFLFTSSVPEQNPNGSNINDNLKMYIHNNVIMCNGTGVSGRNTVQIRGLYFEDNIIVCKNDMFGGMASDTLSRWQSQASGNLLIKQKVFDYPAIDAHKIADAANGNFQIAHNSHLVYAGAGKRFKYDLRGYKRWYDSITPCGSFLGKYKDFSVSDTPITLDSININDDAVSTTEASLKIGYTFTGDAKSYRIGEQSNLSYQAWVDIEKTGVIDYTIEGDFGMIDINLQLSDGIRMSEIRSARIEYVNNYGGQITYDTFTLRIPTADLINGLDGLSVTVPPCKYGKQFALSFTSDDSLLGIYTKAFNYIHARFVDSRDIYHSGMPAGSGSMPTRKLSYTDGCGNEIPFRLGSAWMEGNPDYDIHSDGNNTLSYMWRSEGKRFSDFGNVVMNHGGGDASNPTESINNTAQQIVPMTGHYPYMHVIPGGSSGYSDAANAIEGIYALESTEYNGTANSLNLAMLSGNLMKLHIGRTYIDGWSLDNIKQAIIKNGNNSRWVNLFCHSIKSGSAAGQLNVDVCFQFLDYVYDTYGKGGSDTVWFASNAEIYEHVFARLNSIVEKKIEYDYAVVTVKAAKLPNFFYNELSLAVSGASLANCVIEGAKIKNCNKGNSLINILYANHVEAQAEFYTAAFESVQNNDTLEDAKFFINRLSASAQFSYLARLATLQTAPTLTSVSINDGATEVYKQDVTLKTTYSGIVTHCRASENATLSGAQWVAGDTMRFKLSATVGAKTIYMQMRNSYGESAIVSSTVELCATGARTAIVSLGWGGTEISNSTPGLSVYDSGTGMTRFQSSFTATTPRTIYDTTGEQLCTALPSSVAMTMVSNAATKGNATGDNSGVYADTYLEHNSAIGGSSAISENIRFALPAGRYSVSVFANTIWSTRLIANEALTYRVETAEGTVPLVLPAAGVQNNTSTLSDPVEVTVGADGILKVIFGLNGSVASFLYAPINIIKIQQV